MNTVNDTTSRRTRRRLIAIAALAGAAAVASLTIAATSGASTSPLITRGGLQANGGTGSPAAAATGFLENFAVGSIFACDYAAPTDLEQCPKLVETVRFAGRPSGMTYGLGNTATVGNEALVAMTTNYGCFSVYLVPPGSSAPRRSCFSNGDQNLGLPKSVAGFAAAYAASDGWPFGKDKAIPCVKMNGRWYVDVNGDGWYTVLNSGGSTVAGAGFPGSITYPPGAFTPTSVAP
jgi:hypothetical protein